MNLFFYNVDEGYVNYLKEAEKSRRGFTRVPDIEYQNEKKMICGVVLEINGFKYYVPISSYKKKQDNNLLIVLEDDAYNKVKGSLRFNYMFPVTDELINKRDFSKEQPERAEFLRRQWVYCNTIEPEIKKMALETYNAVIEGNDKGLLKASCDFKNLEEAAVKYRI